MTLLTIELLGPPRVSLAGRPLDLRVRKELALLVYLAVQPARPHRRDYLLGLLWPDAPEEVARNNLRVVLAGLRRALGAGADAVLQIDRQQVQFLPPGDHTVDVLTFRRLQAAVHVHPHVAPERCDTCVVALVEAVEHYRGDFLQGFSLPDNAPFEEWAAIEREQLHQQQLDALETLASAAELRGDHPGQCAYARRQLALEPWRESAYAQLMRGLALSGDRSAALAQYAACRRVLADELGLEPSPELTALAAQLRASTPPSRGLDAPMHLEPLLERPALPEAAHVYGRINELTLLRHWLADEGCRLVALLGIGGVGKTTLAAAAARDLARRFDTVAWCSLLNSPPLNELLHNVLGQLTPGALDLPDAQEALIELLLDTLRHARCLVVLDNLESIMRPDQPGVMRVGYEGYAQLLVAAAQRPHRSCVLLTSRERPQGLARLVEDSPLVRLLPLDGLDAGAAAQMLTARGLTMEGAEAGELAQHYSGNPLALRLVAQTVREVFDGDIGAFLATEAPIFDDISAVLDQQVARLSRLEYELLTWLAIEREPTPALALRANLVHSGPQRAVVEAIRSLLRRSLVTQSGRGLALQNVVTEYLTDTLVAQVAREITGDLPPTTGQRRSTVSRCARRGRRSTYAPARCALS